MPKPDIKNFEAEDSHVVFDSMKFIYDTGFTVVTGCSVHIVSTDGSTHNGDVSVWFGSIMKDSVLFTNVGSTPVLVEIDFDPDIPLADAISGKVVIQVESP